MTADFASKSPGAGAETEENRRGPCDGDAMPKVSSAGPGANDGGVSPPVRVGTGFDVHAFAEGRKLILGGVHIPYDKGLAGHSDADVLTHALMDAMLGACALGDIGKLFPDNDPKYRGADSVCLLEEVTALLRNKGFVLGNADITVICQAPKIGRYTEEMRQILAQATETVPGAISIKGTTTEGLGFTGRGEGIACQAVCTVIAGEPQGISQYNINRNNRKEQAHR